MSDTEGKKYEIVEVKEFKVDDPIPLENITYFSMESQMYMSKIQPAHTFDSLICHPSFGFPRTVCEKKSKRSKKYSFVSVSDAIIDYVVNISEEDFALTSLKKGYSLPLNDEIRGKIAKYFVKENEFKKFAGGSSINTAQVASNLGMRCAAIGCVGNDDNGYYYINTLRNSGVDTYISIKNGRSAICYCFITPDGQRSFGLDFGVSKQLYKYEVLTSLIEESQFLHFSGFELRENTPMGDTIRLCLEHARMYGTKISMDLGDANLINNSFNTVMEVLSKKVDILFANEEEANILVKKVNEITAHKIDNNNNNNTHESYNNNNNTPSLDLPEENMTDYSILLNFCYVAVIKQGNKGAVAFTSSKDKKIHYQKAYVVENVTDTNGAGDNFQGGFFYGLFRGLDIDTTLKISNFIASKILHLPGANSKARISGIEFLI